MANISKLPFAAHKMQNGRRSAMASKGIQDESSYGFVGLRVELVIISVLGLWGFLAFVVASFAIRLLRNVTLG